MASPYLFEPEVDPSEVNSGSDESESDSDENVLEVSGDDSRLDGNEWCSCGICVAMESAEMCLCCKELESLEFHSLPGTSCITLNEDFQVVCLNRQVLWTALVSLHDREGSPLPPRNNVPNNSLRYAAYRQFTWWVHGHLGKKVRRVIPACVVTKIRAAFPDPNDQYTGYREDGSQQLEMTTAWEF